MWPGHMDDFEGAMEASRMANMLQHVPLAMSLCRVDYANHLKMQSSLSNHMYAPSAFEGYVSQKRKFTLYPHCNWSYHFEEQN